MIVRVLHNALPVPILLYGSEAMIYRERKRFMIRGMQMDNLRGLFGIRRMNRVSNIRIRDLCRVVKGLLKRIFVGK